MFQHLVITALLALAYHTVEIVKCSLIIVTTVCCLFVKQVSQRKKGESSFNLKKKEILMILLGALDFSPFQMHICF